MMVLFKLNHILPVAYAVSSLMTTAFCFSSSVSVTIEMVGSCCSLVTERLTEDNLFEIPKEAADLLYSGCHTFPSLYS